MCRCRRRRMPCGPQSRRPAAARSPERAPRRFAMNTFEYQRASSLGDAAAKLKASPDGPAPARGLTRLPTMNRGWAQPSHLIDLGAIAELRGIRKSGDRLVIGAM